MRARFCTALAILILVTVASTVSAQPGRGRGQGGFGPGRRNDPRFQADQQVFHYLLANHDKITRTVKELPNGVETRTESGDGKVAAAIKEHVRWMKARVEKPSPIRRRDPLFDALFRHANRIDFRMKETAKDTLVTETSKDPFVVKLIQAHARVVSGFVEKGFPEARKNHTVPKPAKPAP